MTESIKRETAKIFPLKLILKGEYILQEGWKPNYIKTFLGNISRLNVIGVIVKIESNNKFLIDDGTASIEVYDFSDEITSKKLNVGDIILLISRIRLINEKLCLVSEIINNTQIVKDDSWFKYRKNYLNRILNFIELYDDEDYVEIPNIIQKPTPSIVEFEIPSIKDIDEAILTSDLILNFIRENDSSIGCSIEKVIEKFGNKSEEVISTLVSMGDVYEIKPGFIKILE
ncbi:MAG: hypothetical protein AB7V77_05320 [Candidatus Woesearchaeota archaeon]